MAAGGGGDALASVILNRAGGGREAERAVIATYAWDRLLVDPIPGPRGLGSFTGLQQVGPRTLLVEGSSLPIAPAGSTLPRVAAELPVRLALLDPYGGGRGMAEQLRDAVSVFDIDRVLVVDVGGDVVARGDESGLKSPLADALALAASCDLPVPVDVAVVGVGLDGELPAEYVRQRLLAMGGGIDALLKPQDAEVVASLFEWHPSEATAMLAAAVAGATGRRRGPRQWDADRAGRHLRPGLALPGGAVDPGEPPGVPFGRARRRWTRSRTSSATCAGSARSTTNGPRPRPRWPDPACRSTARRSRNG